jgi:hypothetical protein
VIKASEEVDPMDVLKKYGLRNEQEMKEIM